MLNTFTKPTPLNTAVLFLVFNRPETTSKVFEAIREAKPPRLYVAADGPREGRVGEHERVAEVREIATSVDWNCEVRTLFRDSNLGCKFAVSSAITWFFEHEEQGIILEDDCLPNLSFFWFCEELLEKYKFDSRIFHIDGSNFNLIDDTYVYDYDFSNYALIWGWATWRRAWINYDIKLKHLEYLKSKEYIKYLFNSREIEQYWIRKLEKTKYHNFDTWDYQWFYTIWSQNGLSIRPRLNLISNIGFGSDATHTKTSNHRLEGRLTFEINVPLEHPEVMIANIDQDRWCSKNRFGLLRNSIWQRLLIVIKSLVK